MAIGTQWESPRAFGSVLGFRCWLAVAGTIGMIGWTAEVVAQSPGRFSERAPGITPGSSFGAQVDTAARQPVSGLKTSVEMTVLLPRFGAGVEGQRWGKLLTDLGVNVQLRSAVGGDELNIEQSVRGTLRTVRVVGRLAPDGRLEFADQVFSSQDLKPLQEWINNLKTYGAQGAPEGQPLWGLSDAQFEAVFAALSVVVETELEGQTLPQALEALPLPAAHPLRMHSTADAWLAQQPSRVIENRVEGLTCGTVLSIVLAEFGLGFHPARTPEGRIELSVRPVQSAGRLWPTGWKLPDETTAGDVVPNLYKFVEIGFDDAALQDVLDAAAVAIEVPILVDYDATRKSGVNLEQKAVSYPYKRTSWSLMLNTIIRKAGLIKEVLADERGRPFVYIAPFVPTPVERAR